MYVHVVSGLHTVNTVCLTIIVLATISSNVCSIVFINRKGHERTLKDKIVTVLCVINCIQSTGYMVELQATVKNVITAQACNAAAFIICTCTYSSIGYFVALTVERYLAIRKPFKYVLWFGESRNNSWWLAFPPIFGILLGIAPLAGWSAYGKSREVATYCGFDFTPTPGPRSYFLSICFFVFVVPLVITATAYASILIDLQRTAQETKRKYGRNSNISRASDNSVREQSLSCFMTGLVYIGCWVPYTIVCFQYYFNADSVSIEFEYISIYLSKISTIASPIIYCLLERRFRLYVHDRMSVHMQPIVRKMSLKV